MAMTTKNNEIVNEEVMENEVMDIDVIDETPEESKIKKIWNKAKKPLAFVAIAAAAFGAGVVTDKLASKGASEEEETTEEEIEE